jgi:hypothetical protein
MVREEAGLFFFRLDSLQKMTGLAEARKGAALLGDGL